MKMLGHQNPADKQEMPFLPHFLPFVARTAAFLDRAAPKAIREEMCHAPIGAGGDEWEFTATVNERVEGHDAGVYTLDGAGPKENVPSGPRIPKGRSLRQPAW